MVDRGFLDENGTYTHCQKIPQCDDWYRRVRRLADHQNEPTAKRACMRDDYLGDASIREKSQGQAAVLQQ